LKTMTDTTPPLTTLAYGDVKTILQQPKGKVYTEDTTLNQNLTSMAQVHAIAHMDGWTLSSFSGCIKRHRHLSHWAWRDMETARWYDRDTSVAIAHHPTAVAFALNKIKPPREGWVAEFEQAWQQPVIVWRHVESGQTVRMSGSDYPGSVAFQRMMDVTAEEMKKQEHQLLQNTAAVARQPTFQTIGTQFDRDDSRKAVEMQRKKESMARQAKIPTEIEFVRHLRSVGLIKMPTFQGYDTDASFNEKVDQAIKEASNRVSKLVFERHEYLEEKAKQNKQQGGSISAERRSCE
jgi:hypothetical protein